MTCFRVLGVALTVLGGGFLSGCVSDGPVYERPGVVVVDRDRDYSRLDRYDRRADYDRYDPPVRRDRYVRYDDRGRRDYRRDIRGREAERRREYCRQYPGDDSCVGRRF